MGLDRDALSLVRAELTATHSRRGVDFSLLDKEWQKLLAYFDSAEMDVTSIPWDVDTSDETS